MAVLRGATNLMREGKLHMALLEYGDKASHPIWNAMKARRRSDAAAPTPQLLAQAVADGMTLWSLQRWAAQLGYDTFFVAELYSSRSVGQLSASPPLPVK